MLGFGDKGILGPTKSLYAWPLLSVEYIITEFKKTPYMESTDYRMQKKKISDLEDRTVEISKLNSNKKKRMIKK